MEYRAVHLGAMNHGIYGNVFGSNESGLPNALPFIPLQFMISLYLK